MIVTKLKSKSARRKPLPEVRLFNPYEKRIETTYPLRRTEADHVAK